MLVMIFHTGNVKSTSTIFDQSSFISNEIESLTNKTKNKIIDFQSFAITGSLGFVAKEMYEAGFFSPFGLIPGNIFNLSPLAYESKSSNSYYSELQSDCKSIYDNRSKLLEGFSRDNDGFNKYCKQKHTKREKNNLNQLVEKYF